ncbi:DUF6191 domain-containing protein [Streptomyces abikoensis]|uniref:DUF6191 domain-containing protein n=1 Tax=Streptomyces abikoensis TaxID=97398 RepID=A0ABW7T884_9ACTN
MFIAPDGRRPPHTPRSLQRDDEQDGAPRTGIDLDTGVARLERHGPA